MRARTRSAQSPNPMHQHRNAFYESHRGFSGAGVDTHTRFLSLTHDGSQKLQIPIPALLHEVGERITRDLLEHLGPEVGPLGWDSVLREPSSELELCAALLRFLLDMLPAAYSLSHTDASVRPEEDDSSRKSGTMALLRVVLVFFHSCSRFGIASRGIHAATRHLSSSHAVRCEVLRSYFEAIALLKRHTLVFAEELERPAPALVEAARHSRAVLFACFGGQGLGTSYFEELAHVTHVYGALCSDFLLQMGDCLLRHTRNQEANDEGLYEKGLDVLSWLRQSSSAPSEQYLRSAPVSMPLIALTQLVHYVVFLRITGLSADAGRRLFAGGLSGHSQGIVSAIVVSSSADDKQLFQNAERALGLLFWLGLRSQRAFTPVHLMRPQVLEDSEKHQEGKPTPMLGVSGLPVERVERFVREANELLPAERQLRVSLWNGPRNAVVTGHPLSLYGLRKRLRKEQGKPSSRTPHSERKRVFSARYLSVTVAFHNASYLEGVAQQVVADAERLRILLDPALLEMPVYSTLDGSDLAPDLRRRFRPIESTGTADSREFTLEVAELILTKPVHWEKATGVVYGGAVSHVIDFGPGGLLGIGRQVASNVEGRGVQVILAGELRSKALTKEKTWLLDADRSSLKLAVHWRHKFAPSVQVMEDGSTRLNTRFTRLTGKPHVMCAGMTPTTANSSFCSAVLRAGYHVELAGGGQHSEAAFEQSVSEIVAKMTPGDSFAVNLLYLNQRQWNFQFPMVLRMRRRQGVPISGITIGAGVPTPERASEIVAQMAEAGLRFLALKPSNVQSIREVVAIARDNAAVKNFGFVLQWTGGRSGGHHSYEDIHEPLLRTYGEIRTCDNLSVVIGGGFGDAQHSLKYITGDWSVDFHYPQMPFDGLLLGSRLMVSEEAGGSPKCKQAIIDAPGVDDSQWEKTYSGAAGGVISVTSEMGEPIHKIATRGVLLWNELDKTIFSIADPKERLAELHRRKDEIIAKLNSDYQRVWFGVTADGSQPCDLDEMTYTQISDRCVQLMYVEKQARWIDPSYLKLLQDWLWRIEERFSSTVKQSQLPNGEDLPAKMPAFLAGFPEASTQIVSAEDVLFFHSLVSRRGQKPVPFIARLDERFETAFKKDSLWQSEDLDSVVGCDEQRVCILHGPVAASYSTCVEPVRTILQRISLQHCTAVGLLNPAPQSPVGRRSSPSDQVLASPDQLRSSTVFSLSDDASKLPEATEWLQTLLNHPEESSHWMQALKAPNVVQGKYLVANVVLRMLQPRAGVRVEISQDRQMVSVFDGQTVSQQKASVPAVQITHEHDTHTVIVTMHHETSDAIIPLHFRFREQRGILHEQMSGRNEAVLGFYRELWLPGGGQRPPRSQYVITQDHLDLFSRSVNLQLGPGRPVPLDYAIVIVWESMIGALLPAIAGTDPLKLVHLRNEFRSQPGGPHFAVGDQVLVESEVRAVTITPTGKTICVKSTIAKHGKLCVAVESEFLVRGTFTDFGSCFELMDDITSTLSLDTRADIALLKSKEWVSLDDQAQLIQPGVQLTFTLESETRGMRENVCTSIKTRGSITTVTSAKEVVTVGHVLYEYQGEARGNVVTAYLDRYAQASSGSRVLFEEAHVMLQEHTIWAPPSGKAYSKASRDWNPIHTNAYFAMVASHGAPIVHGMWASAACRRLVQIFAAENQDGRVRAWNASFEDTVLPGSQLTVELTHVGMVKGALLVHCEMRCDGALVLSAQAEVEQAPSAYVFTGQGSQHVGMGMDLYDESAVAAEIWDEADAHFSACYGFSILDIVRNNPQERTVHFGGRYGAAIRKTYQSMRFHDSEGRQVPLFPSITNDTEWFTFTHPEGLLFATQFAQPALVIMEKAIVADLRHRGLIQNNAPFAGHSLGEYASLASIGDVLPTEELVDVVFYRGLTMRSCVPRDTSGRSQFAMVAVNPFRVAPGFGHRALLLILELVSGACQGLLLQCVNYNVENWQYVVAGHLRSLDVLMHTLDSLYAKRGEILPKVRDLRESGDGKALHALLMPFVGDALQQSQQTFPGETRVQLRRGRASIPLPGIDVPFHSTLLRPGVSSFREYLCAKIKPSFVNVNTLEGAYLPNVVGGRPFSLTKEYVELVHKATSSPVLAEILQDWDVEPPSAEQRQILGHTLLMELLSFQFASPVRWIATQDYLFKECGIERLIEIGPQATLTRMAQRTLKLKYELFDEAVSYLRKPLSFQLNRDEIYYVKAPREEKVSTGAKKQVTPPVATVAATSPSVVQQAPATQAPAITAGFLVKCIVAKKLTIAAEDVSLSKTLRELSAGRSALQNEIVGDIQNEFRSLKMDKMEERPLSSLVDAISPSFSQEKLGATSSKMVIQKRLQPFCGFW